MKVDLINRVALVTGAAGGIGSAIACRFARNGARVAVSDLDVPGGEKLVDDLCRAGHQALFYPMDVTDRAAIGRTTDAIVQNWGNIDILVNNAGINVGPADRFPIDQFNDEQWHKILRVDLDGVYYCSKAVIPHLTGTSGTIINIASVVGLIPFRNQCAFTAAKAGVINLTKAMALELAPRGIRVNVIAPGSILMDKTEQLFYSDPQKAEAMLAHIPLHRPGKPDDIACAALYLASDEASYVTGSVLTVDGGWTCGFARDF
jgi:NAD(P)-dependent dehydrogenase (short-subunit alcohol dehydrogenase family)